MALLMALMGSMAGYLLMGHYTDSAPTGFVLGHVAFAHRGLVEEGQGLCLAPVSAHNETAANPQAVWELAIAFLSLCPPTGFIFKTGIAYPINATLEGTGVGAVRHCNFTTGSFVEPITL